MEPLIEFGSLARAGGAVLGLSLPGLALISRAAFAEKLSHPIRFGLGVVAGLCIFLCLGALAARVGLSFQVFFPISMVLCGISLPLALRPILRGKMWATPVLVGVVLLGIGILSTRSVPVTSDTLDHVATVRAILHTGELEPNAVFYADGDGATPDIRKGFYHTWLALAAKLSGLDPLVLWHSLRPWALMLSVLPFAALARRLLGTRRRARLALIVYPLMVHGSAAWFLDTFLYPHNFNWLVIWSALALMVDEVARMDSGRRIFLLFLAAALPALHVFGPALLLGAGLIVPVSLLFFGRGGRSAPAFALFGAMALASLPLLLLRLAQTYRPINPLHIRISEAFYLTDFLQLAAPEPTLQRFCLPALTLIALSFFYLWRRASRTRERALLVGLAWFPFLVSLNPVVGGLLQPKIGYLFVRFLGIVPFPIVAAAVVADVWERPPRRFLGRWLPIIIVMALIVIRLPSLWSLTFGEGETRNAVISPDAWRDGMALIERDVPEGSTIVTDPATGYALPAYTNHRVLTVLDQHSSPSDSTILERLSDAARVMSPYRPLSEAVEVMRRRGAGYVFINESFTAPFATYFDVRLPAEYERVRARFETPGGPFRKLGSAGRCHLYALARPDWSDTTIDARFRFEADDVPDVVTTGEPERLTDALSLLGVWVNPLECGPGDTLTVTAALLKDRSDLPATSYKMVMRARLELTGEHKRWRPVDRFYARISGQAGGPLLEFASHRRVLDSRYPPNLWDVGDVVVDRFRWVVPIGQEPGVYQVGIRVHPRSLVRNIALSDLARPSGGIGVPVGQLTVRE